MFTINNNSNWEEKKQACSMGIERDREKEELPAVYVNIGPHLELICEHAREQK